MAATLLFLTAGNATAQSSSAQEAQYRQGLYQRETGQPYSAIETLEALLQASPTLNRARLELAVAYYRTLNFTRAKAEAQKVLDDPKTPEAVRLSVLSFLKQLELEEKATFGKPHRLDTNLSLGMHYDSNVTAGPDNAVLSNGLVLTPDSLKHGDWGYVAQAGVTHTWQSPTTGRLRESTTRAGWTSQAGVYYIGYSKLSDYNLGVLTASTGPTLVIGNGWRGNLNFQADRLTLDDRKLALYTSVAPSGTWRVGNGGELTIDAQWVYRNFNRPGDQERDSSYHATGISYGTLLNKGKLAVQTGYKAFNEDAQDISFSNSGYELFLGGRQRLWEGGDVFARAALRHSGFRANAIGFTETRQENEQRLELGASHQYQSGWLDKWQASATVTHINNKANISLYDYDRDMVQFALGRSY
ncbi:MAG: hypothetical protein V4532_15480 [Pseudomonadota bacterium]